MEYAEYCWKKGIPYGKKKGNRYRILSDPYRKWISIEKYQDGRFISTVYDSNLLDFRYLNPVGQQAWQKIAVDNKTSLIRNQDDRAIVYENYTFEGSRCRESLIKSIHGPHLAIQKMYYEELGDPFNGVILYDMENHPVMSKKYSIDDVTGEFSELLEETWEFSGSLQY